MPILNILLIFLLRLKPKKHLPLLLRFPGQTKVQFHQSLLWGTNKFTGLPYIAYMRGYLHSQVLSLFLQLKTLSQQGWLSNSQIDYFLPQSSQAYIYSIPSSRPPVGFPGGTEQLDIQTRTSCPTLPCMWVCELSTSQTGMVFFKGAQMSASR